MKHVSMEAVVRDGNSGMGSRYPLGTGTIFYLWVASVPDPNRDEYGTSIFLTRG
jgi:hypothetical protein